MKWTLHLKFEPVFSSSQRQRSLSLSQFGDFTPSDSALTDPAATRVSAITSPSVTAAISPPSVTAATRVSADQRHLGFRRQHSSSIAVEASRTLWVPTGLFNEIGKPINKGKMYNSHTSPPEVAKAYYKQFQGDFNKFLKARSMEIACGGKMVLAMLGRRTTDHSDPSTSLLWELLAQSFDLLVSHEMIHQEKLDSYNVPFYAPNIIEIEEEVRKEGSFALDDIDIFETNLNASGFKGKMEEFCQWPLGPYKNQCSATTLEERLLMLYSTTILSFSFNVQTTNPNRSSCSPY